MLIRNRSSRGVIYVQEEDVRKELRRVATACALTVEKVEAEGDEMTFNKVQEWLDNY